MAYLLIGCTGQIYLLTVDYVTNLPDKDLKDIKYFQLGHILFKLKDIILHIDKVYRLFKCFGYKTNHTEYNLHIKLYPLKLFDILSNEI